MKAELRTVVSDIGRAVQRRMGGPGAQALADLWSMLRSDYDLPDGDDSTPNPQWTSLVEVFGLSSLEDRLLRVATAAEIDPHLNAAMLHLQGGGVRPTVATALELVGIGLLSPERNLLTAGNTLRRWRLLQVDGDGPLLNRALLVPDRLIEHLLGSSDPDPITVEAAVTIVALATPEAIELHRFVEQGHRFCYLHESAQSASMATAAGALTQSGITWAAVDLRRIPEQSNLSDAIYRLVLDAGLSGYALVIGGFDHLAQSDPSAIRQLMQSPVPVMACGTGSWNPLWANDLPPIIRATRLEEPLAGKLWEFALGDEAALLSESAWTVPALRPEEIIRAAKLALDTARTEGTPLAHRHVIEAARQTAPVTSTPGLRRSTPRAGRADLVLPSRTGAAIDELIGWVTHRRRVLGSGRLTGKASKGDGITALFTGNAGTGKTLAAEVIAQTLGLELMTVELPTIIDKYIGETEKNLERVFVTAEESPAVLFFDEADALFGSRSSVSDSRDRYANQEVAYLLQRMEAFSGVAILATNLRGNLDPAFTRRLHFVIPFLDPDPAVRHRLWAEHLSAIADLDESDPVDLDLLSQHAEITGGAIRNVVLAAAFAGAIDETPVGMRHLLSALSREFDKAGRRLPAELTPPG